ncbi:transposase [Leisingera sp. M527]|nr:transposase [Leisingera sp. M527]
MIHTGIYEEDQLGTRFLPHEEWAFFDRFIRAAHAPNRRKPTDHRLVLDGVFWIARTGAPWRDLPEELGKWPSIYRQFRRGTLAGLREGTMDALNQSGTVPDALQMIPPGVTAAGLPMRTEITPGQTSDCLGFDTAMADNLPEPGILLADRGYDANNIRKKMEARDVLSQIPMRKSRKMRVGVEHSLYSLRNPVERCFNKPRIARPFAPLALTPRMFWA